MNRARWILGATLSGALGCAAALPPTSAPMAPASPIPTAPALAEEAHFAELRQLTFGGENAEAYWSHDGTQLTLQSRLEMAECDRIYRMRLADGVPSLTPVSSGKGATTCSYFSVRLRHPRAHSRAFRPWR